VSNGAAAALSAAAKQLASVSDTARLDAELLMAHALGVERNALLLDPGRYSPPSSFDALLDRRLAHEPVAYILGYRDFWTVWIAVGPGALIPRPDSEALIEAAVAHFGDTGPRTILDLGTGPGTLLLAALDHWPNATGVGIDTSDAALGYAWGNATRIAPGRAEIRHGDWATGVDARFDLVLTNPPYVETGAALDPQVRLYEPTEALFAGTDGLNAYRRLLPQIPALLAPGGFAIVEIGASQRAAVTALAEAQGFTVTCRKDLGGHDRALVCSLSA
jgi:release factor glutamine methyltransferase